MASIKAILSSLEMYFNQCSDNYATTFEISNDILSRAEEMRNEMESDYEKISAQIIRLQILLSDVEAKMNSYECKMNEAMEEAESCQAEIDYLYANPEIITTTDEDGNETTEEKYDYAAIAAAERQRDAALEEYHYYKEKYDNAKNAYREIQSTLNMFELTKNAIHEVSEYIQINIYECKKYLRYSVEEAEYNVRRLEGVIDSLQNYLASCSIYFPERAVSCDFSSTGGSAAVGGGHGNGGVSIQRKKASDNKSNSANKAVAEALQAAYYQDLMNRSQYGVSINQGKIDVQWKKITPERNEIKREEFGQNKNSLIKSWEEINSQEWPTYDQDVYTNSGKLIRRKGDKYDAHHIHPLSLGGENSANNLMPLHALEHFDKQGVHASDSPYGKLEKYYKECE